MTDGRRGRADHGQADVFSRQGDDGEPLRSARLSGVGRNRRAMPRCRSPADLARSVTQIGKKPPAPSLKTRPQARGRRVNSANEQGIIDHPIAGRDRDPARSGSGTTVRLIRKEPLETRALSLSSVIRPPTRSSRKSAGRFVSRMSRQKPALGLDPRVGSRFADKGHAPNIRIYSASSVRTDAQ